MPDDFMLEPEEIEPEPKAPTRPVRLVSTGLAPTAEIPRRKRWRPDDPPCYVPCTTCGALVLRGATGTGVRLTLDLDIKTYVVEWDRRTPEPRLIESRGYPVHRCQSATTEGL